MKGEILLVPRLDTGWGTGHLRRCLGIAAHLGERAVVLALDPSQPESWKSKGLCGPDLRTTCQSGDVWDLVVLDRRETDLESLVEYCGTAPAVALDDTGAARRYVCYVLDVIPGPGRAGPSGANRIAPHLLELPATVRSAPPDAIRRILVTYGGEDRARLTEQTVSWLRRLGVDRTHAVTVVQGPSFGRVVRAQGMSVLNAPTTLAPHLAEHDLVITSFGLSALEAVSCGTPVLLRGPTTYHARLARRVGLPVLEGRLPGRARFKKILGDPARLSQPAATLRERLRPPTPTDEPGYRGLALALERLADSLAEPGAPKGRCPVCDALHPATTRFPDRTYYRCPRTGLRYAVPFPPKRRAYGRSYFFQEYSAQYGRTYLEDFEAIRAVSRSRVRTIGRWIGAPGPIVDIGCAYGPFLAACRDEGYRAAGLDVSEDAVDHVRAVLGLPAWVMDFQRGDLARLRDFGPRALTLWYVIEHFTDLGQVLERANRLLPLGGVLAFSTPSSSGVSGRTDLGVFLERSPMDHYTVWSPECAASVLSRYGFRLVRTRVTGHHPERSPLLAAAGPLGGSLSRLLGLGDTFEAYALKDREATGTS